MANNEKAKPWDVFTVREFTTAQGEVNATWRQVGVAFMNRKEGKLSSVTLKLDAVPVNGELVIMPRKEKSGDGGSHG